MDIGSILGAGLGIASGGLTSLLTAGVPMLFRFFQDKADKEQQVKILTLQNEGAKITGTFKIEEIKTQAEADQHKLDSADYQTAMNSQVEFAKKSPWVAFFSGMVRPMITFAMFGMWGGVKVWAVWHGNVTLDDIWGPDDIATWSYLITFWFGHQAIRQHDSD